MSAAGLGRGGRIQDALLQYRLDLGTVADAIEKPLTGLAGGRGWRIGYETGASSEPASYAAMHLCGERMASLIETCFPESEWIPADEILAVLRARKTRVEVECIRRACGIAGEAFVQGAGFISSGIREIDVANRTRNCLSRGIAHHRDVQRADGFAWCMSGPNSALARLHPASPDVLEPGMLFNVGPAAYFDGYGGVRHCDMIAVTERGYDLLTPFPLNQEDAVESSLVDATTQE